MGGAVHPHREQEEPGCRPSCRWAEPLPTDQAEQQAVKRQQEDIEPLGDDAIGRFDRQQLTEADDEQRVQRGALEGRGELAAQPGVPGVEELEEVGMRHGEVGVAG